MEPRCAPLCAAVNCLLVLRVTGSMCFVVNSVHQRGRITLRVLNEVMAVSCHAVSEQRAFSISGFHFTVKIKNILPKRRDHLPNSKALCYSRDMLMKG